LKRADASATPPLDKPAFITKPQFGIGNDSPLYDDDEQYYSEDEDDDLQEALEQLEYDSGESAFASTLEHILICALLSSHPISLYRTLGFYDLSTSLCHLTETETPNVAPDLYPEPAFDE